MAEVFGHLRSGNSVYGCCICFYPDSIGKETLSREWCALFIAKSNVCS